MLHRRWLCSVHLLCASAVIQDLWSGRTVQVYDEDGSVSCKLVLSFHNPCALTVIEVVPYSEVLYDGFWSHLTPARLGVPRYQNIFRIAVWFLFLFSYSQAGSCMLLLHIYMLNSPNFIQYGNPSIN